LDVILEENTLFPPSRDEIIQKILKEFHLPQKALFQLNSILDGEFPESLLICCHSDCEVCNETIYQALQKAKIVLSNTNIR
jgi:formylmethanofuran dehydrogenase subunit E